MIVEDVAIALTILDHCCNNMNADGTMPTARIAALWKAAYDAGDVSRPFDHHRWTAIRNWLSKLGMLDWTDTAYGDGQACKWQLDKSVREEVAVLLKEKSNIDLSFVATTFVKRHENEHFLKPERKIGNHSRLTRCKMDEGVLELMRSVGMAA